MKRSNQVRRERALLEELLSEIRELGHLSDQQRDALAEVYGERLDKALRAVDEGRVKKYLFEPSGRVVWIVVGAERDYQVLPSVGFCTCDDFYFHVISHEVGLCYHLLAQMMAEALGRFELFEVPDRMYEPLMGEWRRIEVKKRRLPRAEIENVRRAVEAFLSRWEGLRIKQLLEEVKQEGFDVLTTQHLSAILAADPKDRFRCRDGVWSLAEPRPE